MNDDLEAQARELGLKVDARWSDKRLQEEIDRKLAEIPPPGPTHTDEPQPRPEDVPFGGALNPADPREQVAEIKKAKTARVRLLTDYWPAADEQGLIPEGSDRVKAGTVVDLNLTKAKQLILEGKAERADPIPGDE